MDFESFDTFEDMQKAEEKAQKSAAERTKNWQIELAKPGSYAISMAHDLLLFHEILDPLVNVEDPEEKKYIKETYGQEHMKYYKFTRSYSVACEEGELGDIHVSMILAFVTKEYFLAMKEAGWGPPRHYGL